MSNKRVFAYFFLSNTKIGHDAMYTITILAEQNTCIEVKFLGQYVFVTCMILNVANLNVYFIIDFYS